jgi:SOS-response transcriptional repressor LexA
MQKTASNQLILERINLRLKERNLSAQGASKAAKLGPDAIRDLERKPDVLPRLDTLEALAPVLETTPEWLAFGVGSAEGSKNTGGVRVIGEVAAGLWFDVEDVDVPKFTQYPIPTDKRYPVPAQFGLIVRGNSINNIAKEGEVLHCVDIGIATIDPSDGDLVIVERRRAQGSQKEVTAKILRRKGRLIHLHPDSSDERWKRPIVLDPKKAPDDEEIALVAIVIAVYKPLKR